MVNLVKFDQNLVNLENLFKNGYALRKISQASLRFNYEFPTNDYKKFQFHLQFPLTLLIILFHKLQS